VIERTVFPVCSGSTHTHIYMSTIRPNPQSESNNRSSILAAGEPAPEFTLRCTPDQSVSLSEFRGRPVVLAFYPADWSPVCGDQMALYNEMLDEFQEFQAELVGISVDGVWCHAAFAKQNKLHFPLLADFEPKGAVARAYGVYDGKDGICERALFVIDPVGTIHWSYVSPIGVNPGANGILSALEDLKMKSAIPATAK
jgi:peroxiredoxin